MYLQILFVDPYILDTLLFFILYGVCLIYIAGLFIALLFSVQDLKQVIYVVI